MPDPARYLSRPENGNFPRLAVAEALKPPIQNITLEARAPLLLRAAATSISAQPDPEWLEPLWTEPLGNLACAIAARRFNDQQNAALIQRLVPNLNDARKQAGAMLSGLTGLETKLLKKREAVEDMPTVKRVMRLGLWMQGEYELSRARILGLLAPEDAPRSTILLALAKRQPQWALAYLLHDPGYSDRALATFFEHVRWWSVLRPHLSGDPPPFWYWADDRLQRFQVEVLRNWYLLNRHQLTEAS
jgi:hypothetical protein